MITVQYEELKPILDKVFHPILFSLLQKKEVEIKSGVFLKIEGDLSFSVTPIDDNIYVKFKIKPRISIKNMFGISGLVTGVLIKKTGIMLEIDGLPDVFLEA